MKKYCLVLLSLVFVNQSALANARFSVVGAVDYNLDSTSTSVLGVTATTKGGLGYGGGVLVGLGAVEFGGIFISRNYTTTITGMPDVSTSASGIEIPVMARIGGGATTFGIGGFYDLATASGGSANYGLTAGPRFGGNNGGMFVDLRFNYGLKSGSSKDALALVGYAFGK